MLDFVGDMALLAFSAIALFLFVNHLFTFIFLFVEIRLNKNSATTAEISNLLFAKKCLLEFYYMLGKFYLLPYQFFDLTLRPESDKKDFDCAILLIHGYMRNQSDWLWFRKQLLPLGYPIYTLNLTPSLGAIQVITYNSINQKIAEIQQQTNCKEIILIGHSMGGLIASYYSEYTDATNLIKRIITIATPFNGTKLSVLAAGDNAKQMLPGATFANELREKIVRSDKQYFTITTQLDNIVLPWQSTLLPHLQESQQYILTDVTHLALLHSEKVINKIKSWLQ